MPCIQKRRDIRSFVRRERRMTPTQQRLFSSQWLRYGINPNVVIDDLMSLFDRDAPCWLEIGFGNGEALVNMAVTHPEKNYLGVEVHTPGVGKLLTGLDQENIANVRVFKHDAMEVIKQQLPDESLDAVLLFFPDPWPKRRHHRRRLLQSSFLELIACKLKPGGFFHMATDWRGYAEHAMKLLSASPWFHNQNPKGGYVERPLYRPITKFERRGRKLGYDIYDLVFDRSICNSPKIPSKPQ